jgi:polysaccharide biosynthesis/export protein
VRIIITIVSLALAVSACAVTGAPPRPNDDVVQSSRLADLLAERANDADDGAYRIGVGDKVRISVARAEELSGEYTVAEDGHVSLALLGDVVAGGKTEEELAASIRDALGAQYLHSPEVIASVAHFIGRRVSVSGAVARPGFYELRNGRETILDLLTRAGGITEDAGPKIYFSPNTERSAGGKQLAANNVGVQPTALLAAGGEQPIEIDLTDLYQGSTVPALALPVRSGDSIFVKEGGQIFVEGWVEQPKAYPLKRAMTLTQAITRAGGLHFAASPGSVMIARQNREGIIREYRLNFSALKSGAEKDVYLEPGDRIYVSGNPLKVGAWGVYETLATVVRVSIAGGVAAF